MVWMTIKELAAQLGCSRRSVERALDDDGVLDGVQVEQRPATDEDYARGVTRRTSRLVRIVEDECDEIERLTEEGLSLTGSTARTIARLERIYTGEEKRTVFTSKGDKFDDQPWSETAQLNAMMNAEKLRQYLDERERNFIPRELVADVLVSLASMLAGRLDALPARLADRVAVGMSVPEIRERLGAAIDEIRTELGDEAERHLQQMLGSE